MTAALAGKLPKRRLEIWTTCLYIILPINGGFYCSFSSVARWKWIILLLTFWCINWSAATFAFTPKGYLLWRLGQLEYAIPGALQWLHSRLRNSQSIGLAPGSPNPGDCWLWHVLLQLILTLWVASRAEILFHFSRNSTIWLLLYECYMNRRNLSPLMDQQDPGNIADHRPTHTLDRPESPPLCGRKELSRIKGNWRCRSMSICCFGRDQKGTACATSRTVTLQILQQACKKGYNSY